MNAQEQYSDDMLYKMWWFMLAYNASAEKRMQCMDNWRKFRESQS